MSARFHCAARSEVPSIALRVMIFKWKGVYPSDEDVEFHIDSAVKEDEVIVIDQKMFKAEFERQVTLEIE